MYSQGWSSHVPPMIIKYISFNLQCRHTGNFMVKSTIIQVHLFLHCSIIKKSRDAYVERLNGIYGNNLEKVSMLEIVNGLFEGLVNFNR